MYVSTYTTFLYAACCVLLLCDLLLILGVELDLGRVSEGQLLFSEVHPRDEVLEGGLPEVSPSPFCEGTWVGDLEGVLGGDFGGDFGGVFVGDFARALVGDFLGVMLVTVEGALVGDEEFSGEANVCFNFRF